jgi:hypothetical protein
MSTHSSGMLESLPAEGPVDGGFCCVACGYDLRGQRVDAACPECGLPVARTLAVAGRVEAVWVRRVRAGALMLLPMVLASIWVWGLLSAALGLRDAGLELWRVAPWVGVPMFERSGVHIPDNAWVLMPAFAVGVFGLLKLSTPRPPWELGWRDGAGRRVVAVLATTALAGVVLLAALPFLRDAPPLAVPAVLGVLACDTLVWIALWLAVARLSTEARALGLKWSRRVLTASVWIMLLTPAALAGTWIWLLFNYYGRSADRVVGHLWWGCAAFALAHVVLVAGLTGVVARAGRAAAPRRDRLRLLVPPTHPKMARRAMRGHRRLRRAIVVATAVVVAVAHFGWERYQGARPTAQFDGAGLTYGAFTADGGRVLLTSDSTFGDLSLFSTSGWNCVTRFPRRGYLNRVALSGDGTTAAAGDGRTLYVWDAMTGSTLATEAVAPGSGGHMAIALSGDGRHGAVSYYLEQSAVRSIYLIELPRAGTGSTSKATSTAVSCWTQTITQLAFSTDGKRVYSGEDGGVVRVIDVATAREVGRMTARGREVTAVVPAPDGKTLFVAADALYRFDVVTGRLLETMPLLGEPYSCNAVAVSPDGRRVATVDGALRVREVGGGALVARFRREPSAYRAAFSVDGGTVFTVSDGGVLRAWAVPGRRK